MCARVCVCVRVVHVHAHVYLHVYVHVCVHVYAHVYLHVLYMYVHIPKHVCVHVACIHVHENVCTCVRTSVSAYVYICKCELAPLAKLHLYNLGKSISPMNFVEPPY